MLAPTLGRHIHVGALQQFEQSLLHTFATHVAGDGGIVTLTGNLVNLINKDDAPLGCCHVVVSHLQQSSEDALHILAHIACFGKHSSVNDGERHVEHLGNGACKQGFACTCGAHHDDVALFYLHTILVLGLLQTLVVIVNSN